VTGWQARDGRPRGAATWFSPERWSPYDLIVAAICVVVAVSVFIPWFKADVRIRNSQIRGFLIHPPGTLAGLTAHPFLWAVFGLALLQFAVLALRYRPDRPRLTRPVYRQAVAVLAALTAAVVVAAFVLKPRPWYNAGPVPPPFHLVIIWDYGAIAALGGTLIALAISIAVIRDPAMR
jgi:hypothetical protein